MDAARASRPGLTLVAMCIAQGMILLDVTIVNVALPAIQRDLHVSPGNLEWVISAYTLALATLILAGGALGDRYGRKRIYLAGLVVFTVCSALCALARTDPQLIVARALQGVGGALMAALTLSILVDAFPSERRTSAIGTWAAVAGLGFGIGPILGGVLLGAFSWSAVFWVNVPIGVAGVALAAVGVRETRDPGARALDPIGALLAAAGLFLLTFGLIETNRTAWGSPRVVASLAAAVLLLAACVSWERRIPAPMLPLGLLRARQFASACTVFFLVYLSLTGMFFYVTLYFQNLKDWSALRTGLSWIPLNAPFLAVSVNAGRLGARFGARAVVTAGAFVAAAGMLGLASLHVESPYSVVWPCYVLIGLGYGLLVPAVASAAMADVPQGSAGVASGILNSARQVGSSVGLAVLGSLGISAVARSWREAVVALPDPVQLRAASLTQLVAGGQGELVAAAVGPQAAPPAFAAFMSGYRAALCAAGLSLVAAALLASVGLRPAATRALAASTGLANRPPARPSETT
jgi:MFS transporter, DHA2 family, methylenomycin A resistance protein